MAWRAHLEGELVHSFASVAKRALSGALAIVVLIASLGSVMFVALGFATVWFMSGDRRALALGAVSFTAQAVIGVRTAGLLVYAGVAQPVRVVSWFALWMVSFALAWTVLWLT